MVLLSLSLKMLVNLFKRKNPLQLELQQAFRCLGVWVFKVFGLFK